MTGALNATEYRFQGEGITASYFPGGAGGPLVQGRPETYFIYQAIPIWGDGRAG
jgi:hypothetical protein